jgi:hypothetical protein
MTLLQTTVYLEGGKVESAVDANEARRRILL